MGQEAQERRGLLALACAQLGQELATHRLGVAADVHRMLGVLLRELEAVEAQKTSPPQLKEVPK